MSFIRWSTPIYLKSLASAFPSRRIENEEICRLLTNATGRQLRASWIETKTGVRTRFWVGDGESTSSLAHSVATRVLDAIPDEAKAVSGLLLATISGDHLSPPTAPILQRSLDQLYGIGEIGTFDIGAACAGFPVAIYTGASLATAHGRPLLAIAADVRSRYLDHSDFSTLTLFGDAASGCLISCDPSQAQFRVLCGELRTDASQWESIVVPAGGSARPPDSVADPREFKIKMKDGPQLFLRVVRGLSIGVGDFLSRAGCRVTEISWLVPHQANLHLNREVAKSLGVSVDRLVETIADYGNTSGSSSGVALTELLRSGRLNAREKVLVIGAGGGGISAYLLLEAL